MEYKETIVAKGTWYYDKIVPKEIIVFKVPAYFSCTRYDEYDNIIESSPIPNTPDGCIYKTSCGGEEYTLKNIIAWANAQPWGPCEW